MLTEEAVRATLETLKTGRTAQIQAELKQMKSESEELEKRAQHSTKELARILGEQGINVDALRAVNDSKEKLSERLDRIKSRLKDLARQPVNEGPSLIAALSVTNLGNVSAAQCPPLHLTPYYTAAYGPSGNQVLGEYYAGRIDVKIEATGTGEGLFGGGAGRGCVTVDRWFFFLVSDVTRYYSFSVYEPYYGFYLVEAHDGFLSSKEANVKIETAIRAYQYNWKSKKEYPVLSVGGRNINTGARYDDTDLFYYAELLGAGDVAYLLVSQRFCVYARGGSSYSELNFDDGSGNYLPAPYVYVY